MIAAAFLIAIPATLPGSCRGKRAARRPDRPPRQRLKSLKFPDTLRRSPVPAWIIAMAPAHASMTTCDGLSHKFVHGQIRAAPAVDASQGGV
jgi:hypothetical protein